jgi:hypothetical protein
MATVSILAGSFIGFALGAISLVFGAGLTAALMLWMCVGLGSAILATALAMTKPQADVEGQTQAA